MADQKQKQTKVQSKFNLVNIREQFYKQQNEVADTKQQDEEFSKLPPIELMINEREVEKYDPSPDEDKTYKELLYPTLVVYDHKKQETRFLDILKDGLFAYMSRRPTLDGEHWIRLLVCVTIYSEDYDELKKTLDGIYDNLAFFQENNISDDDVCVIVIFDGCKPVHESIIEKLFDKEDKDKRIAENGRITMRKRRNLFLKEDENYPRNTAYVYQMNYEGNFGKGHLPLLMCVKLQNAGKLSSHMWFFRGFCQMLNPSYLVLLDCGTIPTENAIWRMFIAMEGDDQIGGVCGYMGLNIELLVDSQGGPWQYKEFDWISQMGYKFFDVQRCQKFEYSIAHILDKSFESMTGFIHVLPGAFSAYRWAALQKKGEDNNILDDQYLQSVLYKDFTKRKDYNIQKANMFLAEDRILCLEIFCRKGCNYILKYLPDSRAYTDPVKLFTTLMKQRKRWINGSWYAFNHVYFLFKDRLSKSNHSIPRQTIFILSIWYARLQQLMTYYVIGFFFIFLEMSIKVVFAEYYIHWVGPQASLDIILLIIYCIGVITLTYFSQHYKADEKTYLFQIISTILGIFMLLSFGFFVYMALTLFFVKNPINSTVKELISGSSNQLFALIILNFVLYALPMMMNVKYAIFDILFCLKDYMYFSPAYFHTLIIYAFCNVNDLSWGTKGMDAEQKAEQQSIEQAFLKYKVEFIYSWIGKNTILCFIVITLNSNLTIRNWFILLFAYYSIINLGVRSISAFIYMCQYELIDKPKYKIKLMRSRKKYQKDKMRLQEYIQEVNSQMKQPLKKSIIESQNIQRNSWCKYPSLDPTLEASANMNNSQNYPANNNNQDQINKFNESWNLINQSGYLDQPAHGKVTKTTMPQSRKSRFARVNNKRASEQSNVSDRLSQKNSQLMEESTSKALMDQEMRQTKSKFGQRSKLANKFANKAGGADDLKSSSKGFVETYETDATYRRERSQFFRYRKKKF